MMLNMNVFIDWSWYDSGAEEGRKEKKRERIHGFEWEIVDDEDKEREGCISRAMYSKEFL